MYKLRVIIYFVGGLIVRFFITMFFFLAISFSKVASAQDIPYGIFLTKNDLNLKGTPKILNITSGLKGKCEFDEEGHLLLSIDLCTDSGMGTRKFIYDHGVPIKIVTYSVSPIDESVGSIDRVIEYSKDGLVSKMSRFWLGASWGVFRSYHDLKEGNTGLDIMTFAYRKGAQLQTSYAKILNKIIVLGSDLYEFDNEGLLRTKCHISGAEDIQSCDQYVDQIKKPVDSLSKFSKNLPTEYLSTAYSVHYEYLNGVLVLEERVTKGVSVASSDFISRITFSDYKFDDCGNWISRRVVSSTEHPEVQTRDIIYFKKCSKS